MLLLNCPHCGFDAERHTYRCTLHQVICTHCGSGSPRTATEDGAAIVWNARAAQGAPREAQAPEHVRNVMVQAAAKALCSRAYPARSLDEALTTSVSLWQRLLPEAELAVDAALKAQAMLAIHSPSGQWVSVPREPTEAMREAGSASLRRNGNDPESVEADALDVWSDMLAALPASPDGRKKED